MSTTEVSGSDAASDAGEKNVELRAAVIGDVLPDLLGGLHARQRAGAEEHTPVIDGADLHDHQDTHDRAQRQHNPEPGKQSSPGTDKSFRNCIP